MQGALSLSVETTIDELSSQIVDQSRQRLRESQSSASESLTFLKTAFQVAVLRGRVRLPSMPWWPVLR